MYAQTTQGRAYEATTAATTTPAAAAPGPLRPPRGRRGRTATASYPFQRSTSRSSRLRRPSNADTTAAAAATATGPMFLHERERRQERGLLQGVRASGVGQQGGPAEGHRQERALQLESPLEGPSVPAFHPFCYGWIDGWDRHPPINKVTTYNTLHNNTM